MLHRNEVALTYAEEDRNIGEGLAELKFVEPDPISLEWLDVYWYWLNLGGQIESRKFRAVMAKHYIRSMASSYAQLGSFIASDGATVLPEVNSDLLSRQNRMDGLFGHDSGDKVSGEEPLSRAPTISNLPNPYRLSGSPKA
ncbi:MAG: hypothetical protein JXB30_05130 [Anaerolineae bacterium]|nr:hypothetical protein [Anaerolineae bacterium]